VFEVKRIIAILLFLQLVVIGIIIGMSINVHNFDQLLFAGTTDVEVAFIDADVGLEQLMEFVEKHDLLMTRQVFLDYENLILYATDVSLGDYIILSEGRLPEIGFGEFISNIVQDDENQVGLIQNLTPTFNITLRPMEYIAYLRVDGRYRIHTTDVDLLFELRDAMSDEVNTFQISIPMEDSRTFLETIMMGVFVMPTIITTALIVSTPIIAFLCIGATLLQFSMSKAKESFTQLVHGFSQRKIILNTLKNLLKTMIVSGLSACFVLYGYLVISGLIRFHLQFMLIFLLVFGIVVFTYLVMTAISMWLIFQIFTTHAGIKGYKPDFAIQVLNHVLKVVFIVLFLVGSHVVTISITSLQTQRRHLQNWDVAQYVHRLYLSSFWMFDTEEFEQEIHDLEMLRLELSEMHQGFIMHAENFFVYDNFPFWEHRDDFKIATDGNRVDISPNYLKLNPIYTIDDILVQDKLIWDDLVLNILVPVNLVVYEDLILESYLEEFYWGSLSWHHRDAYIEGIEATEYTIDDLIVNVIYVQNNQYYFTFDTRIRPEDGNRVKDPIVVVHTGNFHPFFMMGLMGSGFYYISDSDDPLADVSDVISSHGLEYTVRFSFSTFGENIEAIRLVEQDIMSGVFTMFALMVTNFIVNYNLISNYFWRNKHTLFSKSLFGYSLSKRHKWFILSFLIYVIPINIIMTLFLGWTALILGFLFLVLDVLLALSFEHRLMKKSFAEVMKGER